MRRLFTLVLGVIVLTLSGAGHLHAVNTGFVQASGTHFEVNGHREYYVGASYYNAMNLASVPADRSQLDTVFAGLQTLGVTNVRIWASSEGLGGSDKLTPALQPTAGSYDADLFAGLDYALKSANDHDLRCIMVLNNNWDWSGGMNQYVAWSPTASVAAPHTDYGQGPRHDYFYTDDNCQQTYRNFINAVVNRANTQRGGLLYKDDPTIFSWELANEPRAQAAGQGVLNTWIDATAGYIKSLDANHMVSTGSEGFFNRGTSPWWENPEWTGTDFVANHTSADIDFASVHIWPWNWRWYPEQAGDIDNMAQMYARCVQFLQEHIDSAKNDLGKPLVLEEFGLLRDSHNPDDNDPLSSTTTERDTLFQMYFDLLFGDADNGGPSAGSNFWTYNGDPPQENEGMYSVYDPHDASTLAIIAAHGAEMHTLIPEPGSFALLLTAAFGLSVRRRLKR